MRNWLIRRSIDAFERRYDYDMSYAREMLEASPRAVMHFSKVVAMAAHREDVPLEAWYAAKIAATLAEDCGPCTQLGVRMAEEAGVKGSVLKAILEGDDRAMGADAALGYRFARATISHDAALDRLHDEVVRRWGARALVSLALVIAATRVFPAVKYALGHGQSCQRVEIAGEGAAVPVRHAA
ncbi:MAG: hypothetical protein AB7P52_00645 [Alphaproteobacteria bacterium]